MLTTPTVIKMQMSTLMLLFLFIGCQDFSLFERGYLVQRKENVILAFTANFSLLIKNLVLFYTWGHKIVGKRTTFSDSHIKFNIPKKVLSNKNKIEKLAKIGHVDSVLS